MSTISPATIKFADISAETKQTFIQKVKKLGNVSDQKLDIDQNGTVEFKETLFFALTAKNWKTYLPALDIIGKNLHPSDPKHLPDKIKTRIATITQTIDNKINLSQDDPKYCDAFIPEFLARGTPTYEHGGLCFGYPKESQGYTREDPNFNATQTFESCLIYQDNLAPKPFYGTCSERTQVLEAALAASNVPCQIDANITETHIYPSYKGRSLDASSIGEIGWKQIVPSALDYYSYNDSDIGRIFSRFAPEHAIDYRKANRLFSQGKWTAALSIYDRAIRQTPKQFGLFKMLADSTLLQKTPQKQLSLAIKIIQKWPDNPYSQWPLLQVLYAHIPQIPKMAKTLKRKLPNSGLFETAMSIHARLQNNPKKTSQYCNQALVKNQNNIPMLQHKAYSLMEQGKLADAKLVIQKAVAIAPNWQFNHTILSQIAIMENDIPTAMHENIKESTIFAFNPNSQLSSANLYLSMFHPTRALHSLQQHLSNYPLDPTVLMLQSSANLMLGHGDEARHAIYKAIQLSREMHYIDNSLSHQLAIVELAQGNIKKTEAIIAYLPAKTIYTQALILDILITAKKLDNAEKLLAAIKKQFPLSTNIHEEYRAYIHMAKSEWDKAEAIFDSRIAKNPLDLNSKLSRIRIHLERGSLIDKIKAYHQLSELSEQFPYVYDIKTLIPQFQLRIGMYSQSVKSIDYMMQTFPLAKSDLNLHIASAVAHFKLGHHDKALESTSIVIEKLTQEGISAQTAYALAARIHLAQNDIYQARQASKLSQQSKALPANMFQDMIDFDTLSADIHAMEAKNDK